MSSLKDIMDVDVEPLESQAYRRSKEAAQLQASLQPIVPSTETSPPSIIDHNQGSVPIKRRRSNRGSNLPSQSPTVKRTVSSRRSSAGGENMDFTSGYQMGGSSKSGSPSRRSEPTDGGGIAVKYTPVTGRVSKAKKGVPVHTCEACRPVKTFTRAEHLRRHQLSHQKPAYPCTFEDCERAFHRPDLLTRHMHRHETQGEKAYKSEDPRNRRASSSASETRTPSLKVETPSQLPLLNTNQGPSMDSTTPRTSGSGESTITASSFGTITDHLSSVSFKAGSGSLKRTAVDAQLSNPEYSNPSIGPSRTPGSFNSMSGFSTFSRPIQPMFEEPFATEVNSQYPGLNTTPDLPLLKIPEENWPPGLSYNNSPWCSSASDTTEGSGRYGRSNSISTLPDWSVSATAVPHWSPHTMSNTSHDLRTPPFDTMLEHYDNTYVSSPRVTPPLSARSHHLDVPAYGSFTFSMDTVGTPLSTFIKPVAQNFPASPTRISKSGLEIPRRKQSLVGLQQLNSTFTMNSISTFQPRPNLDVYISSFWQNFHPLSPLIHKPTFDSTKSNLLTSAMAAIGTQYVNTPEARSIGTELNQACKKGIERCLGWDMPTRQAILLTEAFSRFRGRKIDVRLSRHFEELYSRLLKESNNEHIPVLAQSPNMSSPSEGLLDRFSDQRRTQDIHASETHSDWYTFLDQEGRRRLLVACFMFDVHQSMCHQQPRSKAIRDNSQPLIHMPCPESIWDATNALDWEILRSNYIVQPLHLLEGELSSQYVLNLSPFPQSLLICWFAAQLPAREDLQYPDDFHFLPQSTNSNAGIDNFMSLFHTSPLAHTYLSLYHTPLHSLLAIACDTWVFGKKITPPSAFHAAQACLKIWSTSLTAARATHHACQVLSAALSQPLESTNNCGNNNNNNNNTQSLSNYWSLYTAALTCWAFGNRYQTSGSNAPNRSASLNPTTPTAGSLPRSSSRSSELGSAVDTSIAEENRRKALSYVTKMLGFSSPEELLTAKACVRADTQGVIEAVKQRLELETVGSKCGLLIDAVVVLGKIRNAGRGSWF